MGMPAKSFEELAKETPPAETTTPTTPPAEEKKDECCGKCQKSDGDVGQGSL